ncbi:hypothetical protein JKP88DRAFT_196577 [Tribonema minus]|uniref:Protein Abitram n=1 Tax=Tribonema minus TaxID=303371 RepID=A0A835YJD3_9STRA|nr:hypothetical protein JKP88DRAFT_196577 [Tribonema minus]
MVLNCHPNGLVILCIARSHFLAQAEPAAVVKAVFPRHPVPASAGSNRKKSANGSSGPGVLPADAAVCHVELSDGTSLPIPACLAGELIEVNEQLLTEPQLLVSEPLGRGYVGILRPTQRQGDSIKAKLKELGIDGGREAHDTADQ